MVESEQPGRETFQQVLKAGRLQEAFVMAMGQAVELNITTEVIPTIGSAEALGHGSAPGLSGDRLHTRIDLVQGDIENQVGDRFLTDQDYHDLRQFHLDQVATGSRLIQNNVENLNRLFTVLGNLLAPPAADPDPAPTLTPLDDPDPFTVPDPDPYGDDPLAAPLADNDLTADLWADDPDPMWDQPIPPLADPPLPELGGDRDPFSAADDLWDAPPLTLPNEIHDSAPLNLTNDPTFAASRPPEPPPFDFSAPDLPSQTEPEALVFPDLDAVFTETPVSPLEVIADDPDTDAFLTEFANEREQPTPPPDEFPSEPALDFSPSPPDFLDNNESLRIEDWDASYLYLDESLSPLPADSPDAIAPQPPPMPPPAVSFTDGLGLEDDEEDWGEFVEFVEDTGEEPDLPNPMIDPFPNATDYTSVVEEDWEDYRSEAAYPLLSDDGAELRPDAVLPWGKNADDPEFSTTEQVWAVDDEPSAGPEPGRSDDEPQP
jgi:hypothetical protein